MSNHEYTANEEQVLMREAANSNDQKRLKELSNSVYMNVRRAVARNNNVDSNIINTMAQREHASTVLYWLFIHPKCTVSKMLCSEDMAHACVTCPVSEINLQRECMQCSH